jgi:hypothetical protein
MFLSFVIDNGNDSQTCSCNHLFLYTPYCCHGQWIFDRYRMRLYLFHHHHCRRCQTWLFKAYVGTIFECCRINDSSKTQQFIKNLTIHQKLDESWRSCRGQVGIHMFFSKNLMIHQKLDDSLKTQWFIKNLLMIFLPEETFLNVRNHFLKPFIFSM